jgi:hypothetical protein
MLLVFRGCRLGFFSNAAVNVDGLQLTAAGHFGSLANIS